MSRIVVVGGTDRIGWPLCAALIRGGHVVAVFSRDPSHAAAVVTGAAGHVAWQPDSVGECRDHLAAAGTIIYLAGGPLFDGRRHSRADITAESRARVRAIDHLVTVLGGLRPRPATLIAASSVGVYGYASTSDARL